MSDTKPTKSSILHELESIKGLLLDDTTIPTLQEVFEQPTDNQFLVNNPESKESVAEHQQDFFTEPETPPQRTLSRNSPIKAIGENPFLPEHIRSRLQGNNPPPLFANEVAKKIASSHRPSTLLGSTHMRTSTTVNPTTQDIIENIIAEQLPALEQQLRERLSALSIDVLRELTPPL